MQNVSGASEEGGLGRRKAGSVTLKATFECLVFRVIETLWHLTPVAPVAQRYLVTL